MKKYSINEQVMIALSPFGPLLKEKGVTLEEWFQIREESEKDTYLRFQLEQLKMPPNRKLENL